MSNYRTILPLFILAFSIGCPGPGPGPGSPLEPAIEIHNSLNQVQTSPVVYFGQPEVQVFLLENSYGTGSTNKNVTWSVTGPGSLQDQSGNPITTVLDTEPIFYLPPATGSGNAYSEIKANYIDIFNTPHSVKLYLTIFVLNNPTYIQTIK